MESIKEMAESILSDLMNNIPISELLLKAKIFASKKGDQDLSNWIDHELNGYKEKPPVYRMLDAGVKIKIQTEEIIDIRRPMDMIRNESVRKKLNYMPVFLPIVEIEQITKSRLDIITEDLPRPICIPYSFMLMGEKYKEPINMSMLSHFVIYLLV